MTAPSRTPSALRLSNDRQRGFSLIGFLSTLTLLGLTGLLLVRAGPSVLEYWAVGKAISAASATASTPEDFRHTFDKLAAAGYIDSIQGKDLDITGTGTAMEVRFAYQKTIPLFGSASLLIDYRGSNTQAVPEKAAN